MGSEKRTSFAGRVGWVLAAAAFLALGALWRIDRARVWESPRWDDGGLIVLRAAEPEDACPESHDTRPEPEGGREPVSDDGAPRAPIETWAVAVNPLCAHCRASLARGLALRRVARAPVRVAALVVDTKKRPPAATVDALAADELRWDSTGAWRHRWGHRVYGELLCFDRAGRFIRTLAPLSDSLEVRRALRVAASLRAEGGS